MKKIELHEDQALVMQIVSELGEEDFEDLVETLKFDRPTLLNIMHNLQHKHLLVIKNTSYGIYIRLSARGKKTMQLLWPELPYVRYS